MVFLHPVASLISFLFVVIEVIGFLVVFVLFSSPISNIMPMPTCLHECDTQVWLSLGNVG